MFDAQGPQAGAQTAPRLEVAGLSRSFGGRRVVEDVSLSIGAGQVTCLLGPSGCGKSTTLRMIAGVDMQDAGTIRVDGRIVCDTVTRVPPEERGIGLMFQDFALFPHLPIIENVAFGLKNLPPEEARTIARHALERVGLAHYAQSYPHHLSGGEQQRVALARALVPRPQVMLMDEPFSGLDQRLRESVRAETLTLLRETRASCLLVTHDPVEAMGLADRIFLMRQGHLIQSGTPEQLYRQPVDAAAARFFSDTNELKGRVSGEAVETLLGRFPVPSQVKGAEALVLIRPQGIKRGEAGSGTEGLVTEARFQGDDVKCSVLFKGIEEPLTALINSRSAPQRGETAWFRIDPEHVFVFESATSQPI